MIYLIQFKAFETIVAKDLTQEQINNIRRIKSTMSRDEYAGYAAEEQDKFDKIKSVVGNNREHTVEVWKAWPTQKICYIKHMNGTTQTIITTVIESGLFGLSALLVVGVFYVVTNLRPPNSPPLREISNKARLKGRLSPFG